MRISRQISRLKLLVGFSSRNPTKSPALRPAAAKMSDNCAVPAEKGYLSAARYMSPELLSRFEPIARGQLKQVVTNRISQFFAVDSEKVANRGPWHLQVERFERSAAIERFEHRSDSVGRTETERKPFQYRVTLQYVERTQQNPYGLVVSSIEQPDTLKQP